MKHKYLIFIATIIILLLTACTKESVEEEVEKPVTLQPIEGTDLNRLTLTAEAAERLGLETVAVRSQEIKGVEEQVIPYAALLYDPSGMAWVYVNDGPLVFFRQAVTVDFIDGNDVFITEGPDAGANVVTLGATELFGSESEFEEE